MFKVGLIGIDNSHGVIYTQLLNQLDPSAGLEPISDARMTHYWQAERDTLALTRDGKPNEAANRERIEGMGAVRVASQADMLGLVDAVIVAPYWNRNNLELARPSLEAGMPVFVDKILSTRLEDAGQIARLVRKGGSPVVSHSALRYVSDVQMVCDRREEIGRIETAVMVGPGELWPYGMHSLDPILHVMDERIVALTARADEAKHVAQLQFANGASVSLMLRRFGVEPPRWHLSYFGQKQNGAFEVGLKNLYYNSLRFAIDVLSGRRKPPAVEGLLEVPLVLHAIEQASGSNAWIDVDALRTGTLRD